VGAEVENAIRLRTLAIYKYAAQYALERGIIIADTKLEFGCIRSAEGGFDPSAVILVDEVLTPDSSRFWPEKSFQPGRPQPSFDKQPLRDYLDAQRRTGSWNGEAPPPRLPEEVVQATSDRYLEIFRLLTGTPLHTVSFD
jgi:phosphoribosylaminoimidazole-succinocarboxamide synthase